MMNLDWREDEGRLKELQAFFNDIGPDALFFSHYELERRTNVPASEWRIFLTHPQVNDWLNQEHRLLKQSELRKMTRNISENARSTGTAQTLAAISKSLEGEQVKEGPVFIYCYTPLSPEEEQAPNVQKQDTDPFRLKG